MTYVTTAGGYYFPEEFGPGYVRALCRDYYGINSFRLVKALGLDIDGADPDAILAAAMENGSSLLALMTYANEDSCILSLKRLTDADNIELSAEDCLRQHTDLTISNLQSIGAEDVNAEYSTMTFAGMELPCALLTYSLNGGARNQLMVAQKTAGYAAIYELASGETETIDQLIDAWAPLA